MRHIYMRNTDSPIIIAYSSHYKRTRNIRESAICYLRPVLPNWNLKLPIRPGKITQITQIAINKLPINYPNKKIVKIQYFERKSPVWSLLSERLTGKSTLLPYFTEVEMLKFFNSAILLFKKLFFDKVWPKLRLEDTFEKKTINSTSWESLLQTSKAILSKTKTHTPVLLPVTLIFKRSSL